MMKPFLILLLSLLMICPALAEFPDEALMAWGQSPADIPAPDEAALADALNAPGGTLIFTVPEGAWPMVVAEQDGISGVTSTNVMQDSSISAIATTFSAKAGDALVLSFHLSSEPAFDRFEITVNSKLVKTFTGEQPARTWAFAIPADGAYKVSLAYVKDDADSAGEDSLFLDKIALLTGQDAEAALASNSAFPADSANRLTAIDTARDIGFDDPTFALTGMFGLADYCIASGEVTLAATLTAGTDPGAAYLVSSHDGEAIPMDTLLKDGSYTLRIPVDEDAAYTLVQLFPFVGCDAYQVKSVVIFRDEAAATAFVADCVQDGLRLNGWWYAEATETDDIPLADGADTAT